MKVFLSHTSKDKPNVKHVGAYLESRGGSVWLDAWEMSPGDSLIKKISEGIDSSDKLVVFLSPDSLKSNWVEREINGGVIMEIAEEKGLGSKFVIPVLLEACKVPFFLREKIYANFTDKSFEDACEELMSGIKNEPLRRTLEPYSNGVVGIHDLGKNGNGLYELVIELTANLSPVSGVSSRVVTSGYSYAHKRIGASGDPIRPSISTSSFSGSTFIDDGKTFSVSLKNIELKKGISLFLSFYSDVPIEVVEIEFKDGYGRDV
ncbi:toll/interleukin-1 receptor domain-containing protein [Pseudomonas caricapapayae]|uniref:toll/interleukin-1 receptor domain-containing protein n=1 Tax=Pseudomonas caricapapayae TaxID=46678 RepID=UPI00168023A7|nr:toll/interleukin-1 receptor domain-containing protein [Pseudomonas caricapapayae]